MLHEIIGDALSTRHHRVFAFLPISRTDNAVLISLNDTIEHTNNFLHIATKREIVLHLRANHTILTNDEYTADSYAVILEEDVISTSKFLTLKTIPSTILCQSPTLLLSAMIGWLILVPNPPSFFSVFFHALCTCAVSHEAPTTYRE